MRSLLRTAAILAFLAANALPASADVVEVRVLEGKQANPPATHPETGISRVPRDAKVVASIEALADAGGAFRAKCVVGGETLRLNGRVTAARDGNRRVQVEFSRRNASGLQEVTTIVILAARGQEVIGVSAGGDSARFTVLTLKEDEDPANEQGD